jgi:hypothetical protein
MHDECCPVFFKVYLFLCVMVVLVISFQSSSYFHSITLPQVVVLAPHLPLADGLRLLFLSFYAFLQQCLFMGFLLLNFLPLVTIK